MKTLVTSQQVHQVSQQPYYKVVGKYVKDKPDLIRSCYSSELALTLSEIFMKGGKFKEVTIFDPSGSIYQQTES